MIKVAITGSHGTGKTTIANRLAEHAKEVGWPVKVVVSPTRHIKLLGARYGMSNNFGLDYQFEWLLMAEMRLRQWVAEREQLVYFERPLPSDDFHTLLIGDRCLLDPLSYVADNINRLRSGAIKFDPGDFKRMRYLYELGHHFAFADVTSFWHKIYYKPPNPAHPITVDADRIGDLDYQRDVDVEVLRHWNEARLIGVPVMRLDVDRDKAADQIWADVLAVAPEITARRKQQKSRT